MLKVKSNAGSYAVIEQGDLESMEGRNLLTASSMCYDGQTNVPGNKNWANASVNEAGDKTYTKEGFHYVTLGHGGPYSSWGIVFYLEDLNLEIGDTITFSYDVKGTFGPENQGCTISHASKTDQQRWGVLLPGQPFPLSIQNWTRVSRTYTIDENFGPEKGETKLKLVFYFGGATPADVWVRNIKIERGSIATDWTPAPEDIEARLEALETALAQLQSGSE